MGNLLFKEEGYDEEYDDEKHIQEEENELTYLPGYDELRTMICKQNAYFKDGFRIGLTEDGEVIISCEDILTVLGRTNHQKQFIKKCGKNITCSWTDSHVKYIINHEGVQKVNQEKEKLIPMMDTTNIKLLILYNIQVTRPSSHEKDLLFEQFQLDDIEFKTPFLPSVENETIGHILRSIPFISLRHYQVGQYKVDCYLPDINMVIECDEYDHKKYNKQKETERELFIMNELKCTMIRYNPHEENFNILDVIHEIIFKMLTPEYQALVQKNVFNVKDKS